MSVPNQVPIVTYTANGTTASFPITFDLHDERYLVVTVNKERPPVGSYAVNLEDGAVVFRTPPNNGDEVTLARDTVPDRQTNFESYNNSMRPEAFNYDFDKVWHFLQEQNLIDAISLARLKDEIEWRRTHDFNYDMLAQVREKQIFDGLKQYVDTFISATNPNIFGGVTAGVVFALDHKSVQTHLEEIADQLEQSREDIKDRPTNELFKQELNKKANTLDVEKEFELTNSRIQAAEKGLLIFSFEADLLKQKPLTEPVAGKAYDTRKEWIWETRAPDTQPKWHDTGLSELDQAKGYADSMIKYAHDATELDLNNMSEIKTYLLNKDKAYLNLPENIARDDHLKMIVTPVSINHFQQDIFNINAASKVWSRVCRKSDGKGVWRSPFNDYVGVFDGVDPISLIEPGGYVLTNGLNLPDGFSGSALVDVSIKGGFTTRTIMQTSDASKKWEKINNSDWADVTHFELTNDRFPAGYNYRGLFTDADLNELRSEGNYLVNGTPINAPDWIVGTQYINTKVFGAFRVQESRSATTSNQIAQRTGAIIDGIWSWGEWYKIGDNYRGLFTDADLNDLNKTGRYIVNGSIINGASFIRGTQYLDVKEYGAFRVQQATSSASSDVVGQRTGRFAAGNVIWTEWHKIGGASNTSGSGSSLSGKTIAVIGDSIVEQGDWPERVAERYGATALRFGFGGCRSGRYESSPLGYDKQCMYSIAKNINTGDYSSLIAGAEWTRDNKNDDNTPQAIAMSQVDWNKVDILCIAYGTNDWTGLRVGDELVADPEGKTTRGALCYSVEQIQGKYPHIQIVLIGMSFRLRGSGADESVNSDNTPNTFGLYLKEYQQAILDVAKKYHLPAYDMYRLSGVNEMTHKKYLRDGVHPIPLTGYQHWANKIGSFLKSNL